MHYPVLVFPLAGQTVVVAHDQGFFNEAMKSQLKAGFFAVPFRVVDSNGVEFCAEKISVGEGIGPYGGWDLWLNRRLGIEVSFHTLNEVSITQLRGWVTSALDDDPTGIWLGGELAPEEMSEKIDSCNTALDIIRVLS